MRKTLKEVLATQEARSLERLNAADARRDQIEYSTFEGEAMTWTMTHCHFPTFENEEEARKYEEEQQAKHAALVAEREQFIVTEQRAYPPHELTAAEKRRKAPPPTHFWVARIAGDWREGTGTTEERAIGDLWLMYSHEIIERIQR